MFYNSNQSIFKLINGLSVSTASFISYEESTAHKVMNK